MGCNYEFKGQLYTKEELVKLLENNKGVQNEIKFLLLNKDDRFSAEPMGEEFDESINDDDLFDNSIIPIGDKYLSRIEKLIAYQKSLVSTLKIKENNLKSNLKKLLDKKKIIEQTKLLNETKERIESLERKINSVTTKAEISLENLKLQTEEDLKRLTNIINTGNLNDMKEAKRIINFYKSLEIADDKISVDNVLIEENPFFDDDVIYNEGKIILDPEYVQFFNSTALLFKEKQIELNNIQRKILVDKINENPKVKKLYNQLTYDEITKALPDTTWIDALMYDASKSAFTDNGVIAKIAMDIFQDVMTEGIVHAKQFEDKHNKLLPAVEKALAKLGFEYGRIYKNYSYDIFFQKDEFGNSTTKPVHRFSDKFFTAREVVNKDFKVKLVNAETNYEDNPEKISEEVYNAIQEKQKWYRENVILLDVNKIPEILEDFPEFKKYYQNDNGEHVNQLKTLLGQDGYTEYVEQQKNQIKKYINWREPTIETFLEENGVSSLSDLPLNKQSYLQFLIASKNPFLSSRTFYKDIETKINDKKVNHTMDYNISVPRKTLGKQSKKLGPNKEYIIEDTNIPTNYYDSNFEIIEKEPALKEYHKLIVDELQTVMNSFPEEVSKKILNKSLAVMRQTTVEILAEPNVSFLKKLVNAISHIYDRLITGFGVNIEDSISYENLDVSTNTGEPFVNIGPISNSKQKIKNVFEIKAAKILAELKKENPGLELNKITKYTKLYSKTLLPDNLISELAAGLNMSTNDFLKRFKNELPLGKILTSISTNEISNESSTNLPKIIKYLSVLSSEYRSRQEILPLMEVMKNEYSKVKKEDRNNVGSKIINHFTNKMKNKGTRNIAIAQFENWFNREILGNYETKSFGVVPSNLDERKNAKEKLKALVSGRILTFKEKKYRKDLDKLINEEKDEETKKQLINIKEKLGKNFALSAMVNNFLNYQRILALGWNLKSAYTNFMEGITANIIIAGSGKYFNPNLFWRANNIVSGSFVKSQSLGLIQTEGAKKARFFSDKWDVAQDSSNELQKASINTPLSKFENVTNPMEINKRVEYLNQTPLLVSIMLDTPVKNKNNKVGNLWDALNPDGTLKPEYNTPENVENWVNNNTQEFKNFKSKVQQCIMETHGNYAKFRGMMLKSSQIGKIAIFMKTWIGSYIHIRLGIEQDDLESTTKNWKGRYRSHTISSAALHGAVVGFAGGNIFGAGVGFAAGASIGFINKRLNQNNLQSNLSTIKELAFLGKSIALKSFQIPINLITGREIIKNPDYNKLFNDEKFTEVDVKNMRALVSEISLLMLQVSLFFVGKMFWDDDDDEESFDRMTHNFIVNTAMDLISSSTTYTNPYSLVDQLTTFTPIEWFKKSSEWVGAVNDYLQNADIATSGLYAGQSKLLRKTQNLTLPSLLRQDYFGFEYMLTKQREKSPFDRQFFDVEKQERLKMQQEKVLFKNELILKLIEEGYNNENAEKLATKIANKKYRLPRDIDDPDNR